MAEETEPFDVVILGGGNGGYGCAFRASQLGLKVAMVERDKVGGTCLHRGCIPTKALLHSAELADEIRHSDDFGVLTQEPQVDWGKVLSFKDDVVSTMYRGLQGLVKKNKVELVDGDGRLKDPRSVVVSTSDGERILEAGKAVVLASGSYARDLPFIQADGERVQNSLYGLEASDVPGSVLIVGGNYIGLEFASVYRSFGAEVTVLEMLDSIAPAEDTEISKALLEALQKRGIEFKLGVEVSGARTTDTGAEVEISADGGSETLSAERLFLAVGRGPNSEGLGYEENGIKLDRGFVVVDQTFKTSVDGVYAIGDVITVQGYDGIHPQLAHVASLEGMRVAEIIAGNDPAPVDYINIPHVIYCQPEVASVGFTEQAAKEAGMDVVTRKYPFAHLARAVMLGGGQGFVKTVAQKDGAVVGIHILGPHASDLISEGMLVTNWDAYPSDVAEIIHPHPTLSEALGETFLALAGKPLHG